MDTLQEGSLIRCLLLTRLLVLLGLYSSHKRTSERHEQVERLHPAYLEGEYYRKVKHCREDP